MAGSQGRAEGPIPRARGSFQGAGSRTRKGRWPAACRGDERHWFDLKRGGCEDLVPALRFPQVSQPRCRPQGLGGRGSNQLCQPPLDLTHWWAWKGRDNSLSSCLAHFASLSTLNTLPPPSPFPWSGYQIHTWWL